MFSAYILVPVVPYATSIRCPNCGLLTNHSFNYCNSCGIKLLQTIILKICPNCKNRIEEKVRFCPECGHKQP